MKELVYLISAAVLFYAAAVFFMIIKKNRGAVLSIAAGFIVYSAFIVLRGMLSGFFTTYGIFEGVFFMPWVMGFVVLFLSVYSKDTEDALTAAVPLLCFSLFAAFYPKGIIPPTPNKLTIWADIFFITEPFGHACFYLGGWFAALSIVKKRKTADYHSLLVWGFVFFSISQVTGAVWAFLGWGSPFRWGARHFQSAVIWCYYAAYLHIRFLKGWSDLRKMLYAAAGAAVVALCTFGSHFKEMSFPRIGG